MLSIEPVITSCPESCVKLFGTDHGDRRRAAVNRALRLSDTIEQLKASMSGDGSNTGIGADSLLRTDIRASSEPKTRKQPVLRSTLCPF